MKTRLWIAALIFPVINGLLFGLGVIPLLSIPALDEHAKTLFPYIVAASFVAAVPVAWFIAPRLRLSYWERRKARDRRERIASSSFSSSPGH